MTGPWGYELLGAWSTWVPPSCGQGKHTEPYPHQKGFSAIHFSRQTWTLQMSSTSGPYSLPARTTCLVPPVSGTNSPAHFRLPLAKNQANCPIPYLCGRSSHVIISSGFPCPGTLRASSPLTPHNLSHILTFPVLLGRGCRTQNSLPNLRGEAKGMRGFQKQEHVSSCPPLTSTSGLCGEAANEGQ